MKNISSLFAKIPLEIFIVFLLIFIWWSIAASGLVSKTLIASPVEVLGAIRKAFSSDATNREAFQFHAFATIGRALFGWVIAMFFGAIIGIFIARLTYLSRGSDLVIELARALPPILVFPLFLIGFDFDPPAYVWTVIFGCLPVMILAVSSGVRSKSNEKIEMLRLSGAKTPIISAAKVLDAVPDILLGGRLTLAIATTISVVTEMVFTPRSGFGIGALARDAQLDFNTPLFYACLITIGLFGYASNYLLRVCEEKFSYRIIEG